ARARSSPRPEASATEDLVERREELGDLVLRRVVDERQADHAARGIHAHAFERAHSIEMPGAGHDAALAELDVDLRRLLLQWNERDRRRADRRVGRSEDADVAT